ATVACWYNGYADPIEMSKQGYDLVSIPDGSVYIVPALRMAIDYAVDAEANGALEGVVPVVVKEFRAALEDANKVYAKVDATTEEVNETFTRWVNALHMLEFKAGDKTELNRQIEIVEA
ncbi:hypothetical protein GNF86_27025, partial [Clostridium perfringens]